MQYSNEIWRDHIFPLMDDFSLHHTECIFPSDERGTKAFLFNIRRKDKIVTLEELESFYGRENDVDQLQNLLYRAIRGFYPEKLEGCFSEYTRILWAEAPIGPMSFTAYLICFPPIQDEEAIWNALEQAVLEWMKIFLMPVPVRKQKKHPPKSNRHETKERLPEESNGQETEERLPEESDEQETEERLPEESDEQETEERLSEESNGQETKENPPEKSNQPEKKETLVEEYSYTTTRRYQNMKVYRWCAFVLPWCVFLIGLRRGWQPDTLKIIFCVTFLTLYGISLFLKYTGK